MSNTQIVIRLKADGTAQVVGDVRKINAELANISQVSDRANASVKGLSTILSTGARMLGGFFAAQQFAALASDILNTNRSMEMLRAQLVALTGSKEQAKATFEFIQRFAVNTPYEIDGLTKSFIMLQNYGIRPTQQVMEAITNQASKLGASQDTLQGIVMALGQAYAKGKLQAEEMMQLAERGVPVYDLLSKITGQNSAALMEMAKNGELTRDVIEQLIGKMGEMASGSNAAAMDTLNGKISNLSDAWHTFEDTLLNDKGEGVIKDMVDSVTRLVNVINRDLSDAIDNKIAHSQARLKEYNQLGPIGRFYSDISGYDPELEKSRLLSLKNQKAKQDEKQRQVEITKASAAEVAKTMDWLAEIDTFAAEKQDKAAKKRQAAADQTAKAYASQRDSIAKTIEQLRFEIQLTGQSADAQTLMRDIRSATANATAAEVDAITKLIIAKRDLLEADQILAEGEKLAAQQRKDSKLEELRLYEKFNAEEVRIKKEADDAFNARAAGILDDQGLRKALEDMYKTTGKQGADGTQKAFERAIENIQDAFGNMFESMLNGDATQSFQNFAKNIAGTLSKVLSQAMSTSLMNVLAGKSTSGDWTSLIAGGALAIGQMIGGAMQKSAPVRQYSAAEQNTTAGLGTGAMKIADMFSRDLGYSYQTAATIAFNNKAKEFGNMLGKGLEFVLTNQTLKTKIGEFFGKSITGAFDKISNYIGGLFKSIEIDKVIGTSAAGNLSGFAKSAASVIGAIYGVYGLIEGWSKMTTFDKITGTISTISSVISAAVIAAVEAGALAATSAIASVVPVVGWIIAAVINIAQTIKKAIDGDWAGAFDQMLTGGYGAMLEKWTGISNKWFNPGQMLFGEPDKPDITLRNGKTRAGAGSDVFTSEGHAGINTAFGSLLFTIRNTDVSAGAMKKSFGALLETIQTVDSHLYDSLMKLDSAAGIAGKTLAYFSQQQAAGKKFVMTQDLEKADTGAMLKKRYDWLSNMFAESGSEVGKAFDAWFDAISSKFIKKSKQNIVLILGIVDMVSGGLEDFMKLPLSLAKLVTDSVKSVRKGASTEEVFREISGIVESFSLAKEGLKNLGSAASDDRLVTFLSNINKIGFGVTDAGTNLVMYADVLKKLNNNVAKTGDELMTIVETKYKSLKDQGFDNAQTTAYFSSFGLAASLFNEAGVAFAELDLDTVAKSINTLSKEAQQTAKNVVDQAIAENKLGKKKREVAIDTLVAAGKLDAAIVAESEYAVSVSKTTKDLISSMGFVQQLGFVAGKTLGEMSVSATTWTAAARNVKNVFGDMETAMKTFDSIAKSFLSPEEYAGYNLDTANRAIANMQKVYPQLQGITSSSITAMLKSGSGMKQFIEDLAKGDGDLAKTTVEYIQLLMQQKDAQQAVTDSTQAMVDSLKLLSEDQFKTAVDYKRYLSLAALSGVQSAADTLGWNDFVPTGQAPVAQGMPPVVTSNPTSTAIQNQNDAVLAELKQLRTEQQAQALAIAKNTLDTAKILQRWDGDGMPATRVVA